MENTLARGTKPRPRIESFSDLIFGLLLSIGATAMATNPPVATRGSSETLDLLVNGL